MQCFLLVKLCACICNTVIIVYKTQRKAHTQCLFINNFASGIPMMVLELYLGYCASKDLLKTDIV